MTEIRSYRRVFDLERRIYRIDRFRLNPNGVPLRGVVYLVVCAAAIAVLVHVAPAERLLALLPWYARFIVVPALVAGVLTMIRIEGRTFHLAALALARRLAGPRRLVAFKRTGASSVYWQPGDLILLPDGSQSRQRRMRYAGPGVAVARRRDGAGVVLAVGEGARIQLPAAVEGSAR